jgi:hypothetical protein
MNLFYLSVTKSRSPRFTVTAVNIDDHLIFLSFVVTLKMSAFRRENDKTFEDNK